MGDLPLPTQPPTQEEVDAEPKLAPGMVSRLTELEKARLRLRARRARARRSLLVCVCRR